MNTKEFDIVIIGAGIAGISTAYYLSEYFGKHNIALIDPLAPMSLTSAQSGENYRNWWPHPIMADFTNHSIDLMEQLAQLTDNVFNMTRRGYALATRADNVNDLVEQIDRSRHGDSNQIRIHEHSNSTTYQPPISADWQLAPDGFDILSNQNLITAAFPSYSREIRHIIHIRRAGDISSQQLGQYMLDRIKQKGARVIQALVVEIAQPQRFEVKTNQKELGTIYAEKLVNASGPFLNQIAGFLDQHLPVHNVLQQKIAFEDRYCAIPRDMPFSIDLDACLLDWSDDERELLADDEEFDWLTKQIEGNIHCRPDGGDLGKWIKLGWAFNHQRDQPSWEPQLYDQYPEIVLRGASRLNPKLKDYYGRFPSHFRHYGGYYPMTEENWPLIGPMGNEQAFVVGALSGFGTMAACGAGELCARWLTGQSLPAYAEHLSLQRYNNPELIESLQSTDQKGLL